jgi:hypothetical protein
MSPRFQVTFYRISFLTAPLATLLRFQVAAGRWRRVYWSERRDFLLRVFIAEFAEHPFYICTLLEGIHQLNGRGHKSVFPRLEKRQFAMPVENCLKSKPRTSQSLCSNTPALSSQSI